MRNVLVFLLVGSLVWGGLHVYVWRRLLLGVHGTKRLLGWSLCTLGILLGPGAMALGRALGATSAPWIAWTAFLYMGFFILLLTLSLLRDLTLGLLKLTRRLQKPPPQPNPQAPQDPSRRDVLIGALNLGVVSVAGGMTALGYAEARRLAQVVDITVPIKGLPPALDGLKIVQISDVHVGPTIRGSYLQAVVERVNAQDPDLIAITGDLIDGYVDELGPEIAHLSALRARLGVFFVTGNHEYYWDGPAWERFIASLGVQVLSNRHVVISHNNAPVVVAGVTDFSAGRMDEAWRSDPQKALDGAPPDAFRLILAHQPKSVTAIEAAGADLMLSGHTHGGQFFPVNLFVGFAHPFSAGLHAVNDRLQIYVSRGTGYWGPPMRLGAAAEITSLRLKVA